MDLCLPYNNPSVLESLPPTVKALSTSSTQGIRRPRFIPSSYSTFLFSGDRRRHIIGFRARTNRRPLVAVASAEASSRCEFGSLNTPHDPKSPAGKFLSGVLQNDRQYFHIAVAEQLGQLVAERDEALARMNLSLGTTEASLHRKIAELKERECQTSVEDIMYMLIFYKFSEIRVHLVPRLSKCIYNGRLEIWPSKDWELESIHSFEVLEMIKEHLTTVVGWRADSNVTDNWATTKIQRLQLCRIYAASILYGYFLKSASLRHNLELSLSDANCDLNILSDANCDLNINTGTHHPLSDLWSCGLKNVVFGRISSTRSTSVSQVSCSQGNKQEKLSSYVMGFDPETLQMCAKPKSMEAMNLIEKHSYALFGDERTGLLEADEVISTSLASQKRFVLEAVAFGSFLWDTEEYVKTVYKLKEN